MLISSRGKALQLIVGVRAVLSYRPQACSDWLSSRSVSGQEILITLIIITLHPAHTLYWPVSHIRL